MSFFEDFVGRVMPFLTLAVLILGLGYRIRRWQKAAVGNMALFPAASKSRGEMWRKLFGEIFLFSTFRRENRRLWSQTWVFHACLALIFLGHTRLITDWPLRVLFGMSEGAVDSLSAWAGGICGILAMLTCLFLLSRRFTQQRVREISTGEDYSAMVLLLFILVTGNIICCTSYWYSCC